VRLLLDTHLIVWLPLRDPRLTKVVIDAVGSPDNSLHVSPVTAFELTELQRRGRIEVSESISELAALLGFELADLPADLWRMARQLPDIHRDPVDRMLIAHAMAAEFTVVTADDRMRRYPVLTLW
jgi:PIN domain nuclease of toxin-antitoxin system